MPSTKNTNTNTNTSNKTTYSQFSDRLVKNLTISVSKFVKMLTSKLPTGDVATRSGLSQRTIQRLRKTKSF